MFKFFLSIIAFLIIFQLPSISETVKVFEFTEEEMKTLKVRKIKGKTTYTLSTNENGNYLMAEAAGKASGLGKEGKINL